MGVSTNSTVAFICADDESAWAQPFLDIMREPTKGSALGYKTISVSGAGFWNLDTVPVAKCLVKDEGRLIILSTDYYGLLNPARMDLPKSLQAVVYSSCSCQNEPQDPIYAVLAENIRAHSFNDEEEFLEPFWFTNLHTERTAYLEDYIAQEYVNPEDYGKDEDTSFSAHWDTLRVANEEEFKKYFNALIKEMQSSSNLKTPFKDGEQSATVYGYLQSIGEWDPDEDEVEYDWEGCPKYPDWDYTNSTVIGLTEYPPLDLDQYEGLEPKLSEIYEHAKEALEKYREVLKTEPPTEPLTGAELLERVRLMCGTPAVNQQELYRYCGYDNSMDFVQARIAAERDDPEMIAKAKLEAKRRAEEERLLNEKTKIFTPKQTGLDREEYLEIFDAAVAGGDDLTGIITYVKSVETDANNQARFIGYIRERLASYTSPGGRQLREATTGRTIAEVLGKMYENGRWMRFQIEGDPARPYIRNPHGEVVLLNGELQNGTKEQAIDAVKAAGAKWSDELNGDVTAVVQAISPWITASAIKETGAEVITEEIFWLTFKKPEAEPKPIPEEELNSRFSAAIGEAFFDRIFKDAEIYKSRILPNIDEIAANFCEGNEFTPTGNEPDWLLEALRKAGALFEGEEPEPKSQDNAGYPGRAAMLQQLLQSEEFSNGQKLLTEYEELMLAELTETAIRQITSRGQGIVVVNLINDTTSFMSSSNVEGDINLAEEEGDEETLQFLRNLLEKIESNDWDKQVLITLISNGETRTFSLDKEKALQPSGKNEQPYDLLEKVLRQFKEGTEAFFKGKTVCITGLFHTSRSEIQKWLEGFDASVTGSVSKNTDLLITGSKPGSKLQKAKELGVPLLSAETLKQAMEGQCDPTDLAFIFDPNAGDITFTKRLDGINLGDESFAIGNNLRVDVIVPKTYFDISIRHKQNHKLVPAIPTNVEPNIIYWLPDVEEFGALDEDLVADVLGNDGPFEIYDMDQEQRRLVLAEMIRRDVYQFVRNMEIRTELYTEDGDYIKDEVYAKLLGLNPNQTLIVLQD